MFSGEATIHYKNACLSVSLLFVCLFPNSSSEPQRAENLRNDSPWVEEGFRLKSIRIRQTVSRKMKKKQSVYKRHLAFSKASERQKSKSQ